MPSTIRIVRSIVLSAAAALALAGADASRALAQIAVVGNTVEEHVAAPGDSYTGTILVRKC